MRCPKCGAFIEDGKDTCFMCGANVNAYGGPNGVSNNFNQNNNNFNNMDYHNVQITAKDGDKDIFDFIQEHRLLFDLIIFLVVMGITALIGVKYYNTKSKAIEKKPIVNSLYFIVPDDLKKVNGSSNGELLYSRSDSTGTDCSIRITSGTSQSSEHVNEYFNSIIKDKTPELDENGKVKKEDELKEFIYQANVLTVNKVEWSFLNMFYKDNSNGAYSNLKYRYLSALHNGIFYNIEAFNNSNDTKCTSAIDVFSSSLEFLDKE